MEDLPQEEGERSLKFLKMFHSTRYNIQILVYISFICLKALSPKNKFGHMQFVYSPMRVLSELCEVFFFFFISHHVPSLK